MNEKGQSLIEVLTALAVILLVIVALIRATTISMKGSNFSKTQALATRYCQEGMEWVRAERDKSWSNLFGKSGAYCLNTLSWIEDYCSSNAYSLDGKFKREAILSDESGDGIGKMKVKMTVKWLDASGEHQSELVSYFSNWR